MNRYFLLCRSILEQPEITQRELAANLNLSLGTVNTLIKECINRQLVEYHSSFYRLTEAGAAMLEQSQVDGAVILAAGFGSRFVPLTFETPKGLLEVLGERMIERQIRQLHQAGIKDITIVVGYLKEKFEYLIDKYQVKLLYNPEYSAKNTLATLYHARHLLENRNMYVLSSDNWMRSNMFHRYEADPWYSSVFIQGETSEWCLSYNKKGKIQEVTVGGENCWIMYGPVFFSAQWSSQFLPVLSRYYCLPGTEQCYWEQVYLELLNGTAAKKLNQKLNCPELYINYQPADQVYEFENLEELRQFDKKYQTQSDNIALQLISSVFEVAESEIQNIQCLKSGMTNNSFLFQVNENQYICRIPGVGTDLLINRKQEKHVFDTIKSLEISEQVIYFDAETGYKITSYYKNAQNLDARDWEQVTQCMDLLRKFHQLAIKVDHSFNIRERIDFYESLCGPHAPLLFEDYAEVRRKMNQLMDWLDSLARPEVLAHIDSVADNFLFLETNEIRLIDWEYAGMCDPLIDIAMFSIYSYYDDSEVDRLICTYLQRRPDDTEQYIVYAYIALSGFLWSLWAIYKSRLGEEFGEYTMIMYRYAKKYWGNCNKNVIH